MSLYIASCELMCTRNILQGLNPLWTSIPSNLSLVAKMLKSSLLIAPVVWCLLTWMWLYLATAQWEWGQQKTLSLPQAEAMVLHALYMQITIWYIWPEFWLCEENEHLVINTKLPCNSHPFYSWKAAKQYATNWTIWKYYKMNAISMT